MENPNNLPGRPDNTDKILEIYYRESNMLLEIQDAQNYRIYEIGPSNTKKDLGSIAKEFVVNHPNTKTWYASKRAEQQQAQRH